MRECRRTHFRSDTAQRYIRAQRTRSKCRRCFTVLHHPLIPSRLRFLPHNFKFKQEKEDRTLSADTRLYSVWLFESRCIFLFQKRKPDKQSAVVEIVLSLFLFVEFEFISSAGWEFSWIQDGFTFAAGRHFEAEKTKTLTERSLADLCSNVNKILS